MDDTTDPSYWLNWRFFLCALWALITIIAAGILITKFEMLNKKKSQRQDDQSEFEPTGILYKDETWRTSLKAVHPGWLPGYRLIAFGLLSAILITNLAISGIKVFFYYTHKQKVLV